MNSIIFTALEHIFIHISSSIISIVIMIKWITLLVRETPDELHDSSEKGMIATFLSTTGFLICRWIYSGHFPLNNLYESLIFLSCSLYIIYRLLKTSNPQSELNGIIALITISTQGFATSNLLTEIRQPALLVPALQSHWLMMHVSMMLLSYAALVCGSLLSSTLLIIIFQKTISFFFINWNDEKNNIFKKTPFSLVQNYYKNYYKYELIERLDYWSYRVISFGFTFLTIGILCGAVWANEAWGSYWSWDPKETWAFITWTIFAIYLHIRTNQKWKLEDSAFVASMGFILIWICYFGINLLGIGLHSYGSFINK